VELKRSGAVGLPVDRTTLQSDASEDLSERGKEAGPRPELRCLDALHLSDREIEPEPSARRFGPSAR
jgi:hypothetical protein